jgi:hypothetical protein
VDIDTESVQMSYEPEAPDQRGKLIVATLRVAS